MRHAVRVPLFSCALAAGKESKGRGQVDEPADGNTQLPPETEAEEPAPAGADAVLRVSAIPTVGPSKRRPHASHADGPRTEHTLAEHRATEDAKAPPEPELPTPDAEAAARDTALEAQPGPPAPWIEDETGGKDDSPPATLAVDLSSVSETEPVSAALVPDSPVAQDAQAAPVAEELVWSGPQEAAPELPLPVAGPPQLLPATGDEALARAPQSAPAPAQDAAQDGTLAETAATVPERAVWTMTMASAPPAAAVPSTGERTARDLLPYLRLAGQFAGAAVLALTAVVLLLVVAYRWIDPPASTLMLGQRLVGTHIEQTWVPLERISPNLVHAVIVSEDSGFCRHRGVDWPALGEAIESDRGGSTITMQVVKNLFLWPARSYVRKTLEIVLAYLVEAVWPKQRVLEIYLNIAEWGPGIFGAEAAARHHFGKPAARLTAQEAALLAVALPNPLEREPGYPGYLHKRLADNLLTRMRVSRTTMRCVRPLRSGS